MYLSSPLGVLTPAAETEFQSGPLNSEAQAYVFQRTFLKATFDFTPSLTYKLTWNQERKAVVVGGRPTLPLNATPNVGTAFDDEINCNIKREPGTFVLVGSTGVHPVMETPVSLVTGTDDGGPFYVYRAGSPKGVHIPVVAMRGPNRRRPPEGAATPQTPNRWRSTVTTPCSSLDGAR